MEEYTKKVSFLQYFWLLKRNELIRRHNIIPDVKQKKIQKIQKATWENYNIIPAHKIILHWNFVFRRIPSILYKVQKSIKETVDAMREAPHFSIIHIRTTTMTRIQNIDRKIRFKYLNTELPVIHTIAEQQSAALAHVIYYSYSSTPTEKI